MEKEESANYETLAKGVLKPGSLDCESGILPQSYRAPYCLPLVIVICFFLLIYGLIFVECGSSAVECRTQSGRPCRVRIGFAAVSKHCFLYLSAMHQFTQLYK